MKLRSKKVIAVCLMAAMLFTLLPTSAMAETLLIAPNPQVTEPTEEKAVIDSIAFDVAAPQAGAVPAEQITGFDVEGVSRYDETTALYWYDINDPEEAKLTGTFEAGKTYAVIADFRYDKDNYVLAEDLAVTVNGAVIPNEETADSKTHYSVFPDVDILVVQYVFDSVPAASGTDIDSDAAYYESAVFCIENGILAGFPDGTFRPETAVSRAMLSAVLWRLEGCPVVNYAMDYSDVEADDWYAEAVRWAAAERVAVGYGSGVFAPNDAITREQLAAMMYNYAVYKGYDVSVGENTNILSYDDAFDISDWAYPAMQWACGSGLMEPVEEGKIGPSDTVTRAEAAVMVQYFAEQNEVILP